MMRIIEAPGLVAAVFMVSVACNSDIPSVAFVQRDSVGIQVVESVQPAWMGVEAWTVGSEPMIDTKELAPLVSFLRIRAVTMVGDGGIAVANEGANEVVVLQPHTGDITVYGGSGQGPSEFVRLASVARYRADSLVAFDSRASKYTVHDSHGSWHRSVLLTELPARPQEIHPLPDGRILAVASYPGVASGRIRRSLGLHMISADGSSLGPVAMVQSSEVFVFDGGEALPPMARQTHIAVGAEAIYVGEADGMEYREFDSTGRLRRIVRLPTYPLDVPRRIRDSVGTAMRASITDDMPPELVAARRSMVESLPLQYPAYADLIVDTEGCVWLAAFVPSTGLGDDPRVWEVLSPEGRWLGKVTVASNFDIMYIGANYLLGRARDALGVETVQMYALQRELSSRDPRDIVAPR